MSDSTATAREPSMEDILASIRRIIDEEDSRDARPAAEDAVEPEVADGALPVMTAASPDRDASEEETAGEGEGDAIFPERESPFWSRATGRDEGNDEPEAAGDADRASGPTDIFTRARNKLDATNRPSARERMQSLAARARDAEHRSDERLGMADTPTDFDSTEVEESRVLDLTDTVDLSDARETLSSTAPAAPQLPEMPEHPAGDDDILDLTTPIGEEADGVEAGHVESGDSFHVSAMPKPEEEETPEVDHEESLAGPEERGDAAGAESIVPPLSDEADEADEADYDAAFMPSANTYSRFDSLPPEEDAPHDEPAEDAERSRTMPVDAPVEEVVQEESVPAETATEAEVDAESETDADPEAGTAQVYDAPYGADFARLDDEPEPEEPAATYGPDHAEEADAPLDAFSLDAEEEPLGFTDTFGASDVYHDDPPELDDDYSRSFDAPEEPVAARAASDEPGNHDDMETVGGMVRDAMERDPVDYADPAALVSMTSEEISARALASLADVEGEASRRMYASMQVSEKDGSESIEGMVRGMLRPMLREWLDDNLPSMVESAVRGEVERISAKSRRYSRASDED